MAAALGSSASGECQADTDQCSASQSKLALRDRKARSRGGKTFRCVGFENCCMTFSRSEHLARHIRKHTGERPFHCFCGRSFSRLDNLRQHLHTVHAQDAPARRRSHSSLHISHEQFGPLGPLGQLGQHGARQALLSPPVASGKLSLVAPADAPFVPSALLAPAVGPFSYAPQVSRECLALPFSQYRDPHKAACSSYIVATTLACPNGPALGRASPALASTKSATRTSWAADGHIEVAASALQQTKLQQPGGLLAPNAAPRSSVASSALAAPPASAAAVTRSPLSGTSAWLSSVLNSSPKT